MIKKISLTLVFLCLIIAIPLAILGYKKVEIGSSGLALIKMTSQQLQDYSIEIPNIPMIPKFDVGNGWLVVLNFLIDVVNGLSSLINFIIYLLNIVIQLLEFIVLIIRNLIVFRDNLASNAISV